MQVKSRLVMLAALALLALATAACSQSNTPRAELKDAGGQVVGEATLTAASDGAGVQITLRVHDLLPGTHGFHIHTVGKCEAPAFTSAGGHFNPHGKKHGLKSAEGPHAGDTPNLVVQANGTAKVEVVASVSLAEGTTSLFDADGSALVIHANADDEVTDPAGNAGARIACGSSQSKWAETPGSQRRL